MSCGAAGGREEEGRRSKERNLEEEGRKKNSSREGPSFAATDSSGRASSSGPDKGYSSHAALL